MNVPVSSLSAIFKGVIRAASFTDIKPQILVQFRIRLEGENSALWHIVIGNQTENAGIGTDIEEKVVGLQSADPIATESP